MCLRGSEGQVQVRRLHGLLREARPSRAGRAAATRDQSAGADRAEGSSTLPGEGAIEGSQSGDSLRCSPFNVRCRCV